jgi:Arc/MetJ-type ribon-helix-helix transcriptional regulator
MAETEKITVNLNIVDLGRIDLLVEQGFYSNRTDFIRAATRKELDVHGDVFRQSTTLQMVLGIASYTRQELENHRQKGEKLNIRVIGAVYLPADISPELACDTIQSLKIYGTLHASPAVKEALSDRMRN